MKHLFVILGIAFAVACTPKATPAATDAIIPTSENVSKDAEVIKAGSVIFNNQCTKCHKPKDEAVASKTFEELRPILASMVKKARLNSEEVDQVTAYVNAHAKK